MVWIELSGRLAVGGCDLSGELVTGGWERKRVDLGGRGPVYVILMLPFYSHNVHGPAIQEVETDC